MFAHADVTKLLKDKRLAPPVASFYLNADRTHPEGEKYLAGFRKLIHDADRLLAPRTDPLSAIARQRLIDFLPEGLAFLDQSVASESLVRGVALFVSLAPERDHDPRTPAFTAFTLPRPIRSQVLLDARPSVRPLLFLLDQYERVGVIVADRNHARIMTLFLGEMETVKHRASDTPRRHHQGGWKQMLFQRDIDGHIKAHVRAAVRDAVNAFGVSSLQRIVLGGSDETLALMKHDLPHRFQPMIAGTFQAEPHASDAAIVAKALAIAQQDEAADEAKAVEDLADALAHRRGVQGVPEVLRALAERRVQRLLLRRGLRRPGGICENCRTLFSVSAGVCGNCQTPLRAVADVLEHAVEAAADEGAGVEFVTESPTLEAMGGIGALLRF